MEVIILAGGKGTRLRSVVNDRPKPMADIAGKPFLTYLLDYWLGQGCTHLVLSVGYMGQFIEEYFGDAYQGVPISYSHEESPLGTGGAMLKALNLLNFNMFVLANGDSYFGFPFSGMLEQHKNNAADVTLALYETDKSDRYGSITLDNKKKITDFAEKRVGMGPGWINAGVYLFNKRFLVDLEKERCISLENELIPRWLESGIRIQGHQANGFFIDIGIPEDYRFAQSNPNSFQVQY